MVTINKYFLSEFTTLSVCTITVNVACAPGRYEEMVLYPHQSIAQGTREHVDAAASCVIVRRRPYYFIYFNNLLLFYYDDAHHALIVYWRWRI